MTRTPRVRGLLLTLAAVALVIMGYAQGWFSARGLEPDIVVITPVSSIDVSLASAGLTRFARVDLRPTDSIRRFGPFELDATSCSCSLSRTRVLDHY